jgi:hypothetical protein
MRRLKLPWKHTQRLQLHTSVWDAKLMQCLFVLYSRFISFRLTTGDNALTFVALKGFNVGSGNSNMKVNPASSVTAVQ